MLRSLLSLLRFGLIKQVIFDGQTYTPESSIKPDVGRNDLCPCGSGLKFKRCCLSKY